VQKREGTTLQEPISLLEPKRSSLDSSQPAQPLRCFIISNNLFQFYLSADTIVYVN
jgi:hypothetical protein